MNKYVILSLNVSGFQKNFSYDNLVYYLIFLVFFMYIAQVKMQAVRFAVFLIRNYLALNHLISLNWGCFSPLIHFSNNNQLLFLFWESFQDFCSK